MISIRQIRPGMVVELIPRCNANFGMSEIKKLYLGRNVTVNDVDYSRGFFHAVEDIDRGMSWRWHEFCINRIVDTPAECVIDDAAFSAFMDAIGVACG